jgi:hypothetical protein
VATPSQPSLLLLVLLVLLLQSCNYCCWWAGPVRVPGRLCASCLLLLGQQLGQAMGLGVLLQATAAGTMFIHHESQC